MPKKNMSDEERKAWGAKMKAAREQKLRREQGLSDNVVVETPEGAHVPNETLNPGMGEEPKETIGTSEVDELRRQVEELKTYLKLSSELGQPGMAQTQSPQVNSAGTLVGSQERYTVDPDYYPNPVDRLKNEPKLVRFAFNDNYELNFSIQTVSYTNIDNVRMREPRFTLELNRVVFDEDTGERTNGRYVVCRGIFHEDPDAAIAIAREQNLTVDESNEKTFLDEMRYLRFRDWLFEAFYPPKPTTTRQVTERVINGQRVEFFEANNENPQSIPFNDLTKAKS